MSNTIINSVIWITHEESYSDGKTFGVVTNFDLDKNLKKIDSFVYYFHTNENNDGIYIFFESIVELNDYILYGDRKIKRAYMKEDDFDKLLDSDEIKGVFNDYLKWL